MGGIWGAKTAGGQTFPLPVDGVQTEPLSLQVVSLLPVAPQPWGARVWLQPPQLGQRTRTAVTLSQSREQAMNILLDPEVLATR